MKEKSGHSYQLYNFIERLSNLLRAEGWRAGKMHGLQPIQLQMLSYLTICNRYSNTPAGVAEYFGLTKGTVSQSLIALETQGLIEKQASSKDGRVVHILVTRSGELIVDEKLPPALLSTALNELSTAEQEQANHLLKRLLVALHKAHNMRSFGVCSSCRYHQVEGRDSFRCGLTQESLTNEETGLICREHQSAETGD
jgi:MarR family transcriptional regulator, negative regulator of the multidrug operon emrRAB